MRLFGFRLGFLFGGIVGYVLGARAGRQRYEQLAAFGRRLTTSQPVQKVGTEVRGAAGRAGQALEEKATEGVTKITDRVRSGSDGDPAAPPPA